MTQLMTDEANSRAWGSVEVASIETGNAERDEHPRRDRPHRVRPAPAAEARDRRLIVGEKVRVLADISAVRS